MIYLAELHYFWDTPEFHFEKAFTVTAEAVSLWCTNYEAELISAKKGVEITQKSGLLPTDLAQKVSLLTI